ncbi:hypothetical protein SAV14893_039150 [Streptomyces avermitilis]|uniref:Uncharacterized protein n=1 Tax=Streptomyces avermitilis TaxID=33903 RepID=A0A4D4LT70_STRAX|nr:hypothetical protein SAVMC3_51120 [Streptomyces avermitilis]GDY64522.1 hypothetical protein SAV14893_039150 [Streptomyces avermitilis]GDY75305.1 hypothetical protein SAV31267_047900 [Streptomyces avermitilis]GDY84308.1 hypothetical protein SAVCW2_35070 [Streptomyces avermitilis]
MPTDMLLPSTSGPSRASDLRAEGPSSQGFARPDWKCDMADLRKPEEPDRDPGRGPTKAEILIAILTAISALAGCVEQLAR